MWMTVLQMIRDEVRQQIVQQAAVICLRSQSIMCYISGEHLIDLVYLFAVKILSLIRIICNWHIHSVTLLK